MADDPDLDAIEAIYDACDEGRPEAALALARAGLQRSAEDPLLHYLAGRALFELDRPSEALAHLERATVLDPDDPEFRAVEAWALFRAGRFDEAGRSAARAIEGDPRLPEAWHVQGLLHEREHRLDQAEVRFARARDLDPEGFPVPHRFTDAEFERQLAAARDALEPPFRAHLDAVPVLVEDVPGAALLSAEQPYLDPEQTLGLFVGVPLGEPAEGNLPPQIHLFRRNLERYARDGDDLAEQIRVTLYHELGHYLGLDEEDLERSGYA